MSRRKAFFLEPAEPVSNRGQKPRRRGHRDCTMTGRVFSKTKSRRMEHMPEHTLRMKCPFCRSTSFSSWASVRQYKILRCRKCGVGLTTPFPHSTVLRATNSEVYDLQARISLYASNRRALERRYRRAVRRIKRYVPYGALLDVGCNIGFFLCVARKAGFTTTGLELNEECALYGRNHFGLDIRAERLESTGLNDDSFDVVTLFDVLEHVPETGPFLEQVKRVLKPGGLAVFQCPNIDSYMAFLTRGGWIWLTPPDHVYHFTPAVLVKLLKSHGFRIERTATWEPVDAFLANLLHAGHVPGLVLRLLHRVSLSRHMAKAVLGGLQRSWSRRGKGGLIEIYARKVEAER